MMGYESKRKKLTNYMRKIITDRQQSGDEEMDHKLLVANISLDMGVIEKDIEDILLTFQNAGILKLNNDKIIIY
jgi:hypothetical protein